MRMMGSESTKCALEAVMRYLSMGSRILPCNLMAKLMNFLKEAPFLNKKSDLGQKI